MPWMHIGGDLEAQHVKTDTRYIDIQVKGKPQTRLFLSRGALIKALLLFPEYEKDMPDTSELRHKPPNVAAPNHP